MRLLLILLPRKPCRKNQQAIKFAELKGCGLWWTDHPELIWLVQTSKNIHLPRVGIFGQMHGDDSLPKRNGGLYIIDQYVAQERVKYEEYRESIGDVDGSQQQLLVPYILSSCRRSDPPATKAILLEKGEFILAYTEPTSWFQEHPIWMKEEEDRVGIYEMCDMLLLTKEVSIKKYRAELAIMGCLANAPSRPITPTITPIRSLPVPMWQPWHCPLWLSCLGQLYQVRIWKRCLDAFRHHQLTELKY